MLLFVPEDFEEVVNEEENPEDGEAVEAAENPKDDKDQVESVFEDPEDDGSVAEPIKEFLDLALDFISDELLDQFYFPNKDILNTMTQKQEPGRPQFLGPNCETAIIDAIELTSTVFYGLMGVGNFGFPTLQAALEQPEAVREKVRGYIANIRTQHGVGWAGDGLRCHRQSKSHPSCPGPRPNTELK